MELSDADFAALCKRVERSGIRCEACNNFFPGRIRLTGPDVDEQAVRAYYAKALERAATLGVKSIVFGSAGAKRVPEGFDMDRAYQQVVQVTRETGEAAAKYGITIVIEPVRMPDCNIINTFAEGVQLQDRRPRQRKGVIDFYHMVCEERKPRSTAEIRQRVSAPCAFLLSQHSRDRRCT